MARIWSCGFELQSVASGIEWDTTTGSPTINTTTVRSGAASLRCNTSAATAYLQHRWRADAQTVFYVRFYLRVASAPTASCVIYSYGDGSAFNSVLRLETNRTLRPYNATTAIGVASAALNLNQWYCVEISYDDASGSNPHTTRLNGVAFNTAVTGANLAGGGVVRVGVQTATTADLYFDDIAINDGSGTAQTGFPGPGSIVHLLPNATGDTNGFATVVGGTAGAANNYTRVDETTPNDATDYNATTATGTTLTDFFAVEDAAAKGIGSSDTVSLVALGARVGSSATSAANLALKLKGQASGTIQTGSTATVNVNGWVTHSTAAQKTHSLTAYVNPQTGTAWTPSTLDTLQVGYGQATSQSSTRRVSTVWALVEYVPTSAGTVFGAAVAALGDLTASAAGSRPISGTATADAALTGLAIGLRTARGVSSLDLGAFGATVVGARTVPGAMPGQLDGLTATAAASVTVFGTVEAMSSVTAVAVGGALISGSAAADSAALSTALGLVTHSGTIAATLGSVTATAQGGPVRFGTAAASSGTTAAAAGVVTAVAEAATADLGPTSATAVGLTNAVGSGAANLALTATVTGWVELLGTATADLGALHIQAATIPVGFGDATLGALIASAAGLREVSGVADVTYGLIASALGVAELSGSGEAALGDLTATADGLATGANNTAVAALGALITQVAGTREVAGTGVAVLAGGFVAIGSPDREGQLHAVLGDLVAGGVAQRTVQATIPVDLGAFTATAIGSIQGAAPGAASAALGVLTAVAAGKWSWTGRATAAIPFVGIAIAFIHTGYPELSAGRPTMSGTYGTGAPVGGSGVYAGAPTVSTAGAHAVAPASGAAARAVTPALALTAISSSAVPISASNAGPPSGSFLAQAAVPAVASGAGAGAPAPV